MAPLLFSSLAKLDNPKGSVLLAHGYAEHRGRYLRFQEALNDAGYDVWSFDFAGHGTAPGPRAQVDVGALIREHLEARKMLLAESRSDRIFLFGHSMGGLITLASTLLAPAHLEAVAVTGPALRPIPQLHPLVARAGAAAASVFPSLKSVTLDDSLLSRDTSVILDYRADPLVYAGKVPVLTGASMTLQGLQVIKNAPLLAVPVFILHGDEDGLADIEGSIEFVRAAGDLAELVTAEGAYHELLNEPDSTDYMQQIIDWYGKR